MTTNYNEGYQILIRSYKQSLHLILLIDSLKHNLIRYGNENIVHLTIVDDNSNDGSVDRIKKRLEHESVFLGYNIIVNSVNKGINESFFSLASHIQYKKILYIDGDDLVSIDNIIDYMDFCSDKKLVFSKSIIFDGKSFYLNPSSIYIELLSKASKKSWFFKKSMVKLSRGNYFTSPGSFISPQILLDNGLIKKVKALQTIHDYGFWKILIGEKKIPITYYKNSVVIYRASYFHRYNNATFVYKLKSTLLSIILNYVSIITTKKMNYTLIDILSTDRNIKDKMPLKLN